MFIFRAFLHCIFSFMLTIAMLGCAGWGGGGGGVMNLLLLNLGSLFRLHS